MQIRCQYCHRPYALGKQMVNDALDHVIENNLSHYNADCPHCGKVNHVSRADLLRAAPERKKNQPPPHTG